MMMFKRIRFWMVNVLLFLFGTSVLKKIRARLFFLKGRVKLRLNDTAYVEKHLEMFTELRKNAIHMQRPDFDQALEESAHLIQKH